ncbi:Gfo/Idh/MocA family protein [Enterococcus cecorum]|uniref:Gfo/Idh/MocA family oxidoreductase n=2 Tax=Enterococcus cecorum TaxID=44008 RepID=A0AAW9JUA4_9ENTE|nr:Gfo/Idh/MocA family oxidoreductase [Enterococcus cecorum]MDZ5503725.1 Gfo/Idh/MocA family oxidoreductase [Enterococcus cecorum]MDZ5531049.1 Gfo/Idh/MocA family oxidoreductase [Enterococcus cecorum]MDZ5544387.1 Gfo/Idh/MocA family oxidoreductase [Enterococcus cecorum]MDZ5548812.1 Gfo/Idh/MocA family oxidoreductase [Enterococcus cecorum]MDZ5550827.1 Gfo/Idh/MocA family oxidoreductase [Enterococcus cecorum]
MKLAVLGTGKIVQEFLPMIQQVTGVELVALLSTPRSLDKAKEMQVQYYIQEVYTDYETLLSNATIDTVYVALPNHLHYQYTKEALLQGKNVICEKPFTLNAQQLQELIQIATEKRVILLEAITNQYLNNFLQIKKDLAQLGKIKIVECNYSQYSSRYDAFKEGKILPAFDPQKGGGALMDINIYNIHFVVGLFGKPEKVQYLANIERDIDTSGILVLDYGAFKAVCIGAKDSTAQIRSVIQGTDGSIEVLGATNEMPRYERRSKTEIEAVNANLDKHRMYQEFEKFTEVIDQKDLAFALEQLNHSLTVMQVVDQALESANLHLG